MIPNQQKQNKYIKVLVIPPFILVITFVCVYSVSADWFNPFTWFAGDEVILEGSNSRTVISPIKTAKTGEFKVLSQTGNESLYDVVFIPTQTELGLDEGKAMQYRTDYKICAEADFESKIIEIEEKNTTFNVPPQLSYFKGTALARQADLTRTLDKANALSLTPDKFEEGDKYVFCTEPLNPYADTYIKIGEHSIIVIADDNAYIDGLLDNVRVEQGNFSHLEINNSADNFPYDELVAYWSFDGDKENTLLTTVFDLTNNDNDGTLVGTAVINSSSGKYDNGLWVDGNSDYVNVPADAAITPDAYQDFAWSC